MTTTPVRTPVSTPSEAPWRIVAVSGAALAAAMGLGRFVYTPILPLMHQQAGLSAQAGAALATANYAGYFAGAVAATVWPRLTRSTAVFRGTLVVLVASLAAMPLTRDQGAWAALRLIAGIASALIFVTAVSAMLARLPRRATSLAGWGFGGIGVGIVLSAALLLVIGTAGNWRLAWLLAAALTLLLAAGAWGLRVGESSSSGDGQTPFTGRGPGSRRTMGALFASYTLEGAGYIVAGTFLVAAIGQSAPGWAGAAAWGVVGLAAVPSAALWARTTRFASHRTLLFTALVVQAAGIALPAAVPGLPAALVAAALFGGTFIGISTLTLALGAKVGNARSVAALTSGYSVGQIVGPLVTAPLLHDGYQQALLLGATIVVLAAVALLPAPHLRRGGAGDAVAPGRAGTGLDDEGPRVTEPRQ